MSTPRIVVTGIGATTPIGGTAPETWSALLQGVSGTHALEYDWVEKYQLPVHFAAEAVVQPNTVLERPVANRLDPVLRVKEPKDRRRRRHKHLL
jgi:3-oxoacyl-[acyl-carrier-protein] synthase II